MIGAQLTRKNAERFYFGIKSEGTTTPGLQSDNDVLYNSNVVNIVRAWEDWKTGMVNFLMILDDITLPQQYVLQVMQTDIPEPENSVYNDAFVMTDSAQ
ncbi:hypothetical protein DPMN_171659 [Dreissena polymorpha]|uniref:Uncharacterized protein n=1 Tax=Dreissena polymorpha TaxID=45954 RepID=A0A9D4IED0_DREPO|nr:hypothetical protein DPMN_171659 [Dreissena polymorpha]